MRNEDRHTANTAPWNPKVVRHEAPGADGVRLPVELALLGLLALLWGSSYLFIKIAVTTIPPVTLIAARVTIAAIILGAMLWWRGERLPRDARVWAELLVQALFNSIGAWTVLAWGQRQVDSGLASVLNSTSPLFVFVLMLAVGSAAAVSRIKLAGTMLGLFGVVLIVGIDVLAGLGHQVVAQLAILFGAVLYAGAAIYGRRFSGLPPVVTSLGTMLWATIVLVPASLAIDKPLTLRLSGEAILATLVLGGFCTGLALLVYFRLVRTLGSMGVASQSYLRAGIGVVLGIFFLGESFQPIVGVGLALAIAGVAIMNLPARLKKPSS